MGSVTAEAIRDEDKYGGVRIRLVARLASAREPFHVDVGIGDPIWPGPADISLPRLLGQEPIQLRGCPMEMVLAEIGQPRWTSWRRKLQLTETLPEQFGHALDSLKDFADPIIIGSIIDATTWDPAERAWNRAE